LQKDVRAPSGSAGWRRSDGVRPATPRARIELKMCSNYGAKNTDKY